MDRKLVRPPDSNDESGFLPLTSIDILACLLDKLVVEVDAEIQDTVNRVVLGRCMDVVRIVPAHLNRDQDIAVSPVRSFAKQLRW